MSCRSTLILHELFSATLGLFQMFLCLEGNLVAGLLMRQRDSHDFLCSGTPQTLVAKPTLAFGQALERKLHIVALANRNLTRILHVQSGGGCAR